MPAQARERPDLSERVKKKSRCGNAGRESRIERHYPTKNRTAALCGDCLEEKLT